MAEAISSPIGRSINAIRRRFSASAFTPPQGGGGANQQVDPELTRIIIRNTNAVNTVTIQLASVANQVNSLTQSLSAISQSLALSSRLEEQRANAEINRQRQLATLALREGKEGEIENKIVNAAVKPVEVLGKRATNILNALGRYFTTILFGWAGSQTIELLSALATGNKEVLNKYKNTLYTTAGLFVGGLIALSLILDFLKNGLKRLAARLLKFSFRQLKKPFISLINAFRKSAGAVLLKGGIKGADDVIPQTTRLLKGTKVAPMARLGNFFKSSLPFGLFDAGLDIAGGKNPVGAAVDSASAATAGGLVMKSIKPGNFKTNLLRLLLSTGAFFGTKKIVGDKRRELIDGITGNNNQSNASTSDQQISASTDTSSNVSDSDITPPAMSDDNKPKGNGLTADTFSFNPFDIDFDKQNDLNLVKGSSNKKDLNKQSNLQLSEAPPQIINMSSNMGDGSQASTSTSGSSSMGSSVPRIPASNNSNDYIYNSMREYQISVT